MLLAVDIGNTNIVIGCYDGEELQERATLQAVGERLWYVPLAARACHTLGVRVRGTGNYRICALIGEYQ